MFYGRAVGDGVAAGGPLAAGPEGLADGEGLGGLVGVVEGVEGVVVGAVAEGEVGVVVVAFPRMVVWLSAMLIRVRICVKFPLASK